MINLKLLIFTGKVNRLELSLNGGFFYTCGGESVYLELLGVLGSWQTSCTTSIKSDFHGYDTLVWSYSQLDTCAEKLFDVQLNELKFKLRSLHSDDFCPKTLVITLQDNVGKVYRYKASEMNDWVANGVNNHIRTAYKM